jgi:hypothetical protein
MTPKEYESLRNELIELLQKAVSVSSISEAEVDEATRNELDEIYKKAMENQFYIVLVGEFQSGKSTTFNALCGGREISPRGSGIKTSGCIISRASKKSQNRPNSLPGFWPPEKFLPNQEVAGAQPEIRQAFCPERAA